MTAWALAALAVTALIAGAWLVRLDDGQAER